MQLLPEDFERLAPYFEVGFQHFPALGRAGIRKAVNGPFTFAPDGNPLVGPVRGLRELLGGVRGHGRLQPGRRHRPGAVALDGRGRPGAGHPVHGRGALRRLRHPQVHLDQGARELRAALPPGLPERGAAGGAPGAPLADLRPAARRRRRHGRELRPGERAVVRPAGRRRRPRPRPTAARRPSPSCAPSARRCAPPSASTRPPTTASTRSAAAARAPGSTACSPAASRSRAGCALAPMLNPAGRIVGDLSIACLAADRFLIVGSGFAEEFHMRWFWAADPPADVHVRSRGLDAVRRVDRRPAGARAACSRWCALDLSAARVQVLPGRADRGRLCARDPHARRLHRGARLRDLDHAGLLRLALRRPVGGRPQPGPGPLRRPRPLVAAAGEGLRLVQQGLPARLHPRARPGSTASSTSTSPTSPAAPPRSPSAPAAPSGASSSWKSPIPMSRWSATNRS